MTERDLPLLPSEVIASSQRALNEPDDWTDSSLQAHVLFDLAIERTSMVTRQARAQLDAYYDHRSADHLPTRREVNPKRAGRAVDRAIASILSGVMLRGAIFEALELAHVVPKRAEQEALLGSMPVNYLCNGMRPYWTDSGEDNYLVALVRRLDRGLCDYYQHPHVFAYLQAYRELYCRIYDDMTIRSANVDASFDPWNFDPDRLLELDQPIVREVNRIALRHFAETSMNMLRMFPVSIVEAFENDASPLPVTTITELQQLYIAAIPVLSALAGLHVRSETDGNRMISERRDNPFAFGSLICHVDNGEIQGFSWQERAFSHGGKAGRCPGSSALPGLSAQQRRTIDLVRASDQESGVSDGASPFMTTVEAILRVSVFDAPILWSEQLEAHQLCAELDEPGWWNA